MSDSETCCKTILIISNIVWVVIVIVLCICLTKKNTVQISPVKNNVENYPLKKNIVVSTTPIIPKRIHFVFIDKHKHDNPAIKLSPVYEKCKNSIMSMNPGYEFKLWTGKMCRDLICKHYPWFLHHYESFPSFIFKVDAIRLFILHLEGGIYMDLDIECLKPIPPEFLQRDVLLLTNNEYPDSGIIGSVKHHPFFSTCIQTLLFEYINEAIIANGFDNIGVQRTQHCCGTLLLTKACNKFYECIPKNSLDAARYFKQYPFEQTKFTNDPVFVNNFTQSWNTDETGKSLSEFYCLKKDAMDIIRDGYYCDLKIFNT
jgi:mannosyltransferase OCH1-like enzyme